MAIGLENYPNLDTSDLANFPAGKIKDNDGSGNGTPVNALVYGDIHQFFFALLTIAGIAASGVPEGAVNGYQYLQALTTYIRATFATESARGTAEIATQAETNTGSDDTRIVTPAKLHGYLGAWVLQSDIADVIANGGTGITVTGSSIKYKIIGKTMHVLYRATITNTTAPNEFEILIPAGKTYNGGINISAGGGIVFDGSTYKHSRIELQTTATTKIKVNLLAGDTLTNATTTTISGQITFEIA